MSRALIVFVLVLGCSQDAELQKTATKAMAELNAADDAFPKQITEVLRKLMTDLLVAPDRVADSVKTKILPLVDTYLATIDRAVATSDAYLATTDDDRSKRNVETIRKRGESFRKARERFVTFEQRARAGATMDELNQMLMNIGMMLTIGN